MRLNRWTLVLKGAIADRPVVLTAFVVILLAATLVSAIPIYANAVAQSGLRERLERAPATAANVQATVGVFDGQSDPRLDPRVRRIARDVFSATGVSIHRSGESAPFASAGRTVVFGFFDDLSRHARLLAGRWPGAREAPVEVAVPELVGRALRLRVGDAVRARSRLDENQVVAARVVGIYRPERPSSAFWWGNPLAASGANGPLVTTAGSFFALGLQSAELRWRIEPTARRLAIDDVPSLRRRLADLPGRLNEGRPAGEQFELDTNLPGILAGAAQSLRRARAGVLVPSIQLGLLAVYGLLVTTGLLIERRLFRTVSLRLRGATAAQLGTIALMEATLLAVPAVAVAPWVAAASLQALNHVGPLAGIGLRLEPHVSATAYALAACATGVCAAALVAPALRTGRVAATVGRRRLPLAGLAQRARLDLMLALVALLGYWQLRRYHDLLIDNRGGLGLDPFLVAAPALLLLAGALLSLRLVPLAAALGERVAAATRGVVPALGFWQVARRSQGYARSVLLLVLAVAIGVFAATYSRTWQRSQIDQAQHAAGADLLVEPGQAIGAPPPIGLASAYGALGVDEALPAVTDLIDLGRASAESGNLLALDARRAQGVVHVRDDFASGTLGELLRPLAAGRGDIASLPLPGRPTRLALSVQLSVARIGPAIELEPGEGLPPPSLFLYLRDADGVFYLYRLGELTQGRARRFVLDLAHRLPDGRLTEPRYPLSVAGLELEHDVPYVSARRGTFDVRAIEVAAGEKAPWTRVQVGGPPWHASVSGFKLPHELPRVESVSVRGGSVRAVVRTGSFLYPAATLLKNEIVLRPGRDSVRTPAVLASDSYLAATDATVGQTVTLALSGGTHAVRIAGSFHRFSTIDPATPAVVVDLPTYLAFAFATHGDVVQPSHWWLKTGRSHEVAEQLRAAPFRSLGVLSRSERERALLEDPVPLGVIAALAFGFVVAAAFAAVGFAATATAAARTRLLEFAVLRALGLRTSQLSGWISLENALVVVLSLLGGTGLGLLVSWLVLPYVALGTSGETPSPPVRLAVPWSTILWLELTLLGALVAIAVAQIARIRRLRPAPVLRSGEGAVAP